ncbi:MAG TPA: hypothetical protein VFO10_01940 [Oligoflexus sp.]|uniref:hypothetical protein n=1 Tax=Oligoflexus sp. TaxID=1971216 RepID=UPI002D7EC9A4|nr:hypothetical protein [Oligoflexus sp.]HET9235979.1 hypothetical protein [Oligoflexus sp.]
MDINPSRPDAGETGERPLNLSDFAQRNQMTEDRVWELIEEGELAARFVNDEILILREQETADEPQIDFREAPQIAIHDSSDILPIHSEPTMEPPRIDPVIEAAPAPESTSSPEAPRPEPMNFEAQDHHDDDALPADDYRDLLVFAQDAMNRTMDLSRQLLATKDELLRMKDERIQQLQFEQQRNELEIRRLRKKVEDLETLCRLTPNP